MIVVALAMLGSLTVLPALLSRLGDKIDKGRIPFLHRFRDDARAPVLEGDPDPTLKHPVVAVPSPRIAPALALPALQMHTAQSGFEALPKSAPTVATIQRVDAMVLLGDAFGGLAERDGPAPPASWDSRSAIRPSCRPRPVSSDPRASPT